MKVWVIKGQRAGMFVDIPDEDAQKAIDGGWAQPLKGQRSLAKADRSPHPESDAYFTVEHKPLHKQRGGKKGAEDQSYATREMRAEEQPRSSREQRTESAAKEPEPEKPEPEPEASPPPKPVSRAPQHQGRGGRRS